MYDFKGKSVLIVGLGLFGGGVGAVRFFVRKGAEVTVTDLKSRGELVETVEALSDLPVHFVLGGHREEDFRNSDIVVPGPAVHPDSPYLKAAREAGVPVVWRDNLLFLLCRAPIIGVTGSNGKSTATSLLGDILVHHDPRTLVGGNLGGSLLEEVENVPEDVPVVLELSSFQLEALTEVRRSPHIAVVLNFSPDHLDRHGTLRAYAEAKRNILRFQGPEDLAVLNQDDPEVRCWGKGHPGKVWGFSAERPVEGVFLRDGKVWGRRNGEEVVLFERDDLALPGLHNLYNAMAASAAAWAWGVPPETIREEVRAFRGLEHRLEFVREVRGVRYYNDSKATTPEATLAAIRAFGEGVVLIAGGYDKKLPLDELAGEIAHRAKAAVFMGQTGSLLARLVEEAGGESRPRVRLCASLEEAVDEASRLAGPGDVVVLSPACASYDMFRNYEERGKKFKDLVMAL